MDRVQINTPAAITNTWYEGGVAVDPGVVTVDIARADGTALVEDGVTSGSGAAARTYNLTTTHTGLLDRLTVTWTSPTKGIAVTYVEVVGGFLFTLAEARALKPLDQTAVYPTDRLVAMRTTVEEALEDACGVAFVPRYVRETLNGTSGRGLLVKWPYVRTVRSAAIDGTAVTVADIDVGEYVIDLAGGWTAGTGNVVVSYEHGHDRPPEEIKRAALILTRLWLTGQNRPIDDRAITFNTTEGGTYSLAVPGRNGSVFGHPDVDSVVQRYSMHAGVA